MKSLFQTCVAYVSKHAGLLTLDEQSLPDECKDLLLDWMCSHDLLADQYVQLLLRRSDFVGGLRCVNFYLSEQIDDQLLIGIGLCNRRLQQVTVVYCNKVSDRGVRALTERQPRLSKLELKGLANLTSYGVAGVVSDQLRVVDLSDCPRLCSSGVVHLVTHNRNIQRMFLNSCKALDDLAVYAVGAHLGPNLVGLELDFMDHLQDPSAAITYLTDHCPNLCQLSLCRYFADGCDSNFLHLECSLKSNELRELDLYGNYLTVLPKLPDNIAVLRLSCTGAENVQDLSSRLQALPFLNDIRLVLASRETGDSSSFDGVDEFLEILLPRFGNRITGLHVVAYRLRDSTVDLIEEHCQQMSTFSLNVARVSASRVVRLFRDGQRALAFRTLKFCRLLLPCKALAAIGASCRNLEELECSFMPCVDDRFLRLLAANCRRLHSVNFNGCEWVTDKGLCALARGCPLKEVRVRATSVTDKLVYELAQRCPNLEWIAHADYTGKPKFSENALRTLKESCVQRVIC